jgi:hypothetical protein
MIDFNSMIDRHLAREVNKKQIGKYYPSEIGSCLRKIWYSYRYPQEIRPELIKIFEIGNILHDFVVEVLKSERNPEVELLQFEFPLKLEMDGFTISGRVDDLILLKVNNVPVLVEVKSCQNVDWTRQPQMHHVMQLQFYMYATGVHNGILLYIDRERLNSKVFTIPYDSELSERILDKFRTLHNSLVSDQLPKAEAKEDREIAWMCKFCEHREKCDKNEK